VGPLDECALSDISGSPRSRPDFGLFEPPRQQGRPRTAALAEQPTGSSTPPAIYASLDLARDIVRAISMLSKAGAPARPMSSGAPEWPGVASATSRAPSTIGSRCLSPPGCRAARSTITPRCSPTRRCADAAWCNAGATQDWARHRTSAPRSRSGEGVRVRNVASELGQHTAEIFGRLGVSESEIEKLRAQGVVCWSRIETGRATP
jgi:hypothetical protein